MGGVGVSGFFTWMMKLASGRMLSALCDTKETRFTAAHMLITHTGRIYKACQGQLRGFNLPVTLDAPHWECQVVDVLVLEALLYGQKGEKCTNGVRVTNVHKITNKQGLIDISDIRRLLP